MRILMPVLVASTLLVGAPAVAQQFGTPDSDCHALKLKSASGVPYGKIHDYEFSGTCNLISVKPSGPKVMNTVPAIAEARWDSSKLEFVETFQVLAAFNDPSSVFHVGTGVVTSIFKCNDDPLISGARWIKVACGMTTHKNDSGFAPFSNPALKQSRPLLMGKTTLFEASKFSQQAKPPKVPPPPPPTGQPQGGAVALPWKAKSKAAAPVAFEAEQLFEHGKAQANGGALHVQPMQDFGNGWGNNAQLFWSGGAPGAVLDLTFKVQVAGRYRVELFMTRAPDYGDLLLQVEGHTASASFSGYAATVTPSNAIEVGTFQLPAGEPRISLKIISKDAQSTGYLVGVDQVRLFPVVANR